MEVVQPRFELATTWDVDITCSTTCATFLKCFVNFWFVLMELLGETETWSFVDELGNLLVLSSECIPCYIPIKML